MAHRRPILLFFGAAFGALFALPALSQVDSQPVSVDTYFEVLTGDSQPVQFLGADPEDSQGPFDPGTGRSKIRIGSMHGHSGVLVPAGQSIGDVIALSNIAYAAPTEPRYNPQVPRDEAPRDLASIAQALRASLDQAPQRPMIPACNIWTNDFNDGSPYPSLEALASLGFPLEVRTFRYARTPFGPNQADSGWIAWAVNECLRSDFGGVHDPIQLATQRPIIHIALHGVRPSLLERIAIDYAKAVGALVVTTTGSFEAGETPTLYPASYDSPISVGAIAQDGSFPWWSPTLESTDFVVPAQAPQYPGLPANRSWLSDTSSALFVAFYSDYASQILERNLLGTDSLSDEISFHHRAVLALAQRSRGLPDWRDNRFARMGFPQFQDSLRSSFRWIQRSFLPEVGTKAEWEGNDIMIYMTINSERPEFFDVYQDDVGLITRHRSSRDLDLRLRNAPDHGTRSFTICRLFSDTDCARVTAAW